MTHSRALEQFEESLGMAGALLEIENRYHNPPRQEEQKVVMGLRGAVAVLIVAAFETFLKQAVEEHLSSLSSLYQQLSLERLPDKMKVGHIYNSLNRAMKGPPHQNPPPRAQRLPDIERTCKIIIAGGLDPKAFCDTGGNPTAKTVRMIFSDLDLDDITTRIKPQFDRRWHSPTAQTFIDDKLEEIVNRRHVVAHTADALRISRSDLKESVRFLRILAALLDMELAKHVKYLKKLCV